MSHDCAIQVIEHRTVLQPQGLDHGRAPSINIRMSVREERGMAGRSASFGAAELVSIIAPIVHNRGPTHPPQLWAGFVSKFRQMLRTPVSGRALLTSIAG